MKEGTKGGYGKKESSYVDGEYTYFDSIVRVSQADQALPAAQAQQRVKAGTKVEG